MLPLSEEQFKALATLRADAQVRLVGIHQHPALPSCPFTIETADGHFKAPRVLVPLTKRAYDALADYDGPDEGCINELLRRIAEHKAPKGDGLAGAVQDIVDEAVAALKSRVAEAAKGSCDRAVLVEEAVRAIMR